MSAQSSPTYPVTVDASLQPDLSRGLWLVKWLLALPHYVVLAFLWLAFVLLSAVALVAILVTGRYPRAIFDFNVGVLRWTWRVGYYAYGGLGTDQYPPFSLEERADYPAHLEVEYPEHLSRGLVLVKWWLLAIPHYLVVGLFIGAGWLATGPDEARAEWGGGLLGLLVLVAAVVLLFTGRYPQPIFDLVLGLNRWVLRVAAYAGLMTDTYPPFRLDMGGTDPGTALRVTQATPASPGAPDPEASQVPPSAAAPPPAPPRTPGRWSAGRVVAVIAGAVLTLTSLGLLAGGGVLRLADGALRDDDGYLTSDLVDDPAVLESSGYAVHTEPLEIDTGPGASDLPRRWIGEVRVEATGVPSQDVFIGIARADDVAGYLAGVAASQLVEAGDDPVYELTPGDAPRRAPTEETFWVASAAGPGEQELTWEPEEDDWALVVMNADGSGGVAADVEVGATVPVLDEVALALMVAGAVLLVGGVTLLVLALRRTSRADGQRPVTSGT